MKPLIKAEPSMVYKHTKEKMKHNTHTQPNKTSHLLRTGRHFLQKGLLCAVEKTGIPTLEWPSRHTKVGETSFLDRI